MLLRIGHSPDPDDAFMVWALAEGGLPTPGFRVELLPEDIQSLNRRARRGELELTALSAGAYPQVAERYALLSVGSSFGRGCGPIVVTREPRDARWLEGRRIAIPGEDTSAFLLLRLALPDFTPVPGDFTQAMGQVALGEVDAALLIHEGQLTYARQGLHKALDLWDWWKTQASGLPMPLGLNVVRRDLGPALMRAAGELFRASVEAGLAHESEALTYALRFGRGLDVETGTTFVRQYVNADTLCLDGAPLEALRCLYSLARKRGHLSALPDLTPY